jgi:hypothetical protein
MLKHIVSCLFACLLASVSVAQTFESAVQYLEFMAAKKREISESSMSYSSAVAHNKSGRKIDKRRRELVQSTQNAINTIKALPDWKGDVALRDSTVSYLNASYHVLNEDYAKIIDLEEVAEQSYDAMEAYINAQELANEKIKEAQGRVNEQLKVFAKNNNINLIEGKESELDKKIIQTNKVNKHYREIFLIHFKASNQEKYLVEAGNKKDLNALEQSRSALEKYSTEGLAKLTKIKPFNGDNSVVEACRKALLFYQKEAKDGAIIYEFYTKQENFEKLKSAMEAKGENRSKAEVDSFNKSLNEFKAVVAKYNAANNATNKLRAEANNGWNSAVDKFFDKHTPK